MTFSIAGRKLTFADEFSGSGRITLAGDKNYDTHDFVKDLRALAVGLRRDDERERGDDAPEDLERRLQAERRDRDARGHGRQ